MAGGECGDGKPYAVQKAYVTYAYDTYGTESARRRRPGPGLGALRRHGGRREVAPRRIYMCAYYMCVYALGDPVAAAHANRHENSRAEFAQRGKIFISPLVTKQQQKIMNIVSEIILINLGPGPRPGAPGPGGPSARSKGPPPLDPRSVKCLDCIVRSSNTTSNHLL